MQNKKEKGGVGKPTLYKNRMKRINVMLDEDTIKFYTEQGKGNLSKGIRNYWVLSIPIGKQIGESC